jgi:hypothetical protein
MDVGCGAGEENAPNRVSINQKRLGAKLKLHNTQEGDKSLKPMKKSGEPQREREAIPGSASGDLRETRKEAILDVLASELVGGDQIKGSVLERSRNHTVEPGAGSLVSRYGTELGDELLP